MTIIHNASEDRTPPPLGDISTRRLVAMMLTVEATNRTACLPGTIWARGATIEDVRDELRRRSEVGVGVCF